MHSFSFRSALRFMFPGRLLCALGIFVVCAALAQCQVPSEVLTRVLLIPVGAHSGSGCTIDVDGRQYIITAKHFVSEVKDNDSIRIHRIDGWASVRVKVH